MTLSRNLFRLSLLAVTAIAVACADSTGPQPLLPQALRADVGPSLTGAPGFPLPDSVAVRLVSASGEGIAGYEIEFEVLGGGGSVSPAVVTTDESGRAATLWTLGPDAGANRLRAAVRNASIGAVTLDAQGQWGRERSLVLLTPPFTGVLPGGCTPDEIAVRALDAQGMPVPGALVEFTPAEGSGSVTPSSAEADESGIARTQWTLGLEGGTSRLHIRPRSPDAQELTIEAQAAAAAPDGYSVIGNRIYSAQSCEPYRVLGLARPSLEWSVWGDENFGNVAQDFANMAAWHANTVRIPVNQSYWLTGTAQHDPAYRPRVLQTVAHARSLGLNVIIDLHVSDRGDPDYALHPDVQQMADMLHSTRFWREVAEEFKDDGRVMFELYNEPNNIEWDLWLNGGIVEAGPKYPGGPHAEAFEAAGMQDLYDAVRSTGARNLVIVGGTHWGYFLDGVPQHPVQGYNIAYSTHPYDWPDKQPETWYDAFGFLAATHPVIITEFGAYDCTRLWYYDRLLDFADEHGLGWVAWGWWTPPAASETYTEAQRQADICRFPALISDWSGTPSPSGQRIRARLEHLAQD